MNGKTVILFGGTFAPPHLGHVHAAECAVEALKPDKLLIVPTAIPPHKLKVSVDTPEIRLEMCKAAFGHIEKCEISSFEIEKGGVSYTVDTLEHLNGIFDKIYLLCGSDMFLTLDTWHKAERVFELASMVCVPRCDDDKECIFKKKKEYEERFLADVTIIESDVMEISSTEARGAIAAGKKLADVIPRGVEKIVRRENLYCGANEHE